MWIKGMTSLVALVAVAALAANAKAASIVAAGNDFYGQVSNIPTGSDFTVIATVGYHAYALRADGSIAAWGDDIYGNVSNAPAATGFAAIAAGSFNGYALTADGSIVVWIYDAYGLVSNRPMATGFTQLAPAGGFTAYALRVDGSIAAWGLFTHEIPGTGFLAIAAGSDTLYALIPEPHGMGLMLVGAVAILLYCPHARTQSMAGGRRYH